MNFAHPPQHPKIYHVDRSPSIIGDGCLYSDEKIERRKNESAHRVNKNAIEHSSIGFAQIKERILNLPLKSYPDLSVGQCVPFYFCPRSVMLCVISRGNHPKLTYFGGQSPIVHLECDLRKTVNWAEVNDLHWAFTLSNAGSYYFEDRCLLEQISEINRFAIKTRSWREVKDEKQAEFLAEKSFPFVSLTASVYFQGKNVKK